MERPCPNAGQPWHLDCGDDRFVHCCPEATEACRRWLTLDDTVTEDEGWRLHGLRVRTLLGEPDAQPLWIQLGASALFAGIILAPFVLVLALLWLSLRLIWGA